MHPNIFKYVPVNPLVQWFYRKTTEDNFVNLFDDPQERYPDVESEQACSRSHYNTTNFYTCKYVQEKSCSPKYDGQYMCKIHVDLYDSRRTVYNASMFLGKLVIPLYCEKACILSYIELICRFYYYYLL